MPAAFDRRQCHDVPHTDDPRAVPEGLQTSHGVPRQCVCMARTMPLDRLNLLSKPVVDEQ